MVVVGQSDLLLARLATTSRLRWMLSVAWVYLLRIRTTLENSVLSLPDRSQSYLLLVSKDHAGSV